MKNKVLVGVWLLMLISFGSCTVDKNIDVSSSIEQSQLEIEKRPSNKDSWENVEYEEGAWRDTLSHWEIQNLKRDVECVPNKEVAI